MERLIILYVSQDKNLNYHKIGSELRLEKSKPMGYCNWTYSL